MYSKKLEKRAKKLFDVAAGVKIAGVAGTSPALMSKVKTGSSFLPARFIPALVAEYENKGITTAYLYTLTAKWSNEHD